MKFFDFTAPLYGLWRPRARKTFNAINAYAIFSPTDVVVDIGGGAGSIARYFVGKVAKVVVIDPSEKMLEQCRKISGLVCELGVGENLPLADSSVDKILLVDSFHHIYDQLQAIKEMGRVLKSGGQVVAVEYNPDTLGGKGIAFFEILLGMGSTFHNSADLMEMFKKENFSVSVNSAQKSTYLMLASKR